MAETQSTEQRELSLVGKVEMRIALADESKLETTLKTYLAPLLLKLASEHQSVRNKVVSVCQHINTRVKPPSIQLPVKALVEQFKAQDSSMIRHFDLLYIQQGVGRISNAEKAGLLPVVVKGIASSGSHGPQIFNLLLRLLESFTLPLRGSQEDGQLRSRLEVSDEDSAYLASWIGKLLLFVPQKDDSPKGPGITQQDYTFLTLQGKEDVWNPASGGLNLQRTKILSAKLLASGLFNDHERFLPALFASADPASGVSDVGADMMKRALPANDLESEDLIRLLYDLYFGSDDAPRVAAPLRLKILGLLNKSTKSTTFADRIMELVDDGVSTPVMDGEDTVMSGLENKNSIGREATKLRSAIFTYINFVARYGSKDTLYSIGSRVVGRLRDFVENQGWPKVGGNEDLMSRGYAYEVIGLLAKAGSRDILLEEEPVTLDLLRWLFTALASDTSGSSVILCIEEALSVVLSAISQIDLMAAELGALEDLLIHQMEQSADLEGNKRLRSTRYVAIRFANRCLPYNSVKARWVDILGLGATKDRAEVREEAERGLSPYWYRMLNGFSGGTKADDVTFPQFDAVMSQFFQARTIVHTVAPLKLTQEAQALYPESFHEMTGFARRMLFQEAMKEAKIPLNVDQEWERKLDVAVESDIKVRGTIMAYMQNSFGSYEDQLKVLLSALFQGVIGKVNTADSHLVEFLALSPDHLVLELVPWAYALIPILRSNNHDQRVTAAKAFGILVSHPTAESAKTNEQIQELLSLAQSWKSAVGTTTFYCHGAIVALGFYFSRAAYRGTVLSNNDYFKASFETALDILLEARAELLKEASFIFVGQLCMFYLESAQTIEKYTSFRKITDRLYEFAKAGNEHAILCLGQLSMVMSENSTEHSDLLYLEGQLHKLHEIRQAEVHFTVGEAFSYLASGWESGALDTQLDIAGPKPNSTARTETLGRLVDRIIKDCENTKPALKKAAVMWLLCLVKFCGQQKEIQDRLPRCQAAFKRCLVDRDELVQETASRGLGLVYEKGDRSLKDDLVRDLVSAFSSDRQSQLAGTVSADTQLFEPGALPTGDGSISTYKDIMSLAAEVGDSKLVYRFMAMASSNAIWSTRAAFGRFGLSSVLSDSSVDGYLAENPKLYPKLFRYRFDPNGGVQRSMNDIWNALVKDSSATVDKNFDAIMEDLLTSILGKEWRVRQASCAAIADLVSGRPYEKYEKYLEHIWTQCFKVLDDIKDSVRKAAASLARTLTGVLTRTLEADHSSTKNASAMLKHVLPFILSSQGMESSAKEVQAFSIRTLLEIIKKASGGNLRPFIPELVERLIGLLSSVEPEQVNYLHMNAAKYNLTEQKIDDMRLSSVRSSPLMEAIERCLDLLDEESMRELQPRLQNAMKSAIGLPSKVGSSRVLVTLSTRQTFLFRPWADDSLRLVEKLVIDRNETVSSSYAMAAGYIARSASDKQILHLVTFARKLYFESEGDREGLVPRRSITAGELTYAVAKYASDRFNSLASSSLPFVFVAKHDPNETVKEQFENTWNEAVGGSRSILLYLPEILSISNTYLDSPQWALKHTSAKAVADATNAVASIESTISAKVGEQLWPSIEKALAGKTWDGKEAVLGGFVRFVEKGQAYYSQRSEVKDAITKIAIREAKRQNTAYQPHAVKALGQVALARVDVDLSGPTLEIVRTLISRFEDHDKMELDKDSLHKADMEYVFHVRSCTAADRLDRTEATCVAAVEAILASINPSIMSTGALNLTLPMVIDQILTIPSRTNPWRKVFYEGAGKLFDRIRQQGKGETIEFDLKGLKTLLFGPDEIEALRLLRADAIKIISTTSPKLALGMKEEVRALKAAERSANVRDRLNF